MCKGNTGSHKVSSRKSEAFFAATEHISFTSHLKGSLIFLRGKEDWLGQSWACDRHDAFHKKPHLCAILL